MLKIRLSVKGKKSQRSFRVVVIDGRRPRDSRSFLADLGFYNPHSKEIKIDKDNAKKWLKFGAQPTPTVQNLLKKHLPSL